MRTRLLLPLSLLLLAGCPDDEEGPQNSAPPAPTYKDIKIPDSWESDSARIILRITNSSTTTTETHRALTRLFNERLNVGDMLMRGGLRTGPDGAPIPPGTPGTSNPAEHETMLAGTAVEQARAAVERIEIDQIGHFPQELAADACGNPMLASFVTPDTLPYILEGDATQNNIWPKEACGPDISCNTLEHGVWDVAFSETRYDGMVDVAIMLQPDSSGKITRPGLMGHLAGFFLSTNNPGYSRIPLFANIRQASISIQGLLKLDRVSFDSQGLREVYVYPHSARTLTPADIVVALIGHEKCEDVWESTFGYAPPFGCELGTALGLDLGAAAGQIIDQEVFRGDPQGIQQVVDVLAYQIGAAVSCPGVDGAAWVREGPVELFTCPTGDVDLCIGREDTEDFACEYFANPEGDGAPIPAPLGTNAVMGSTSAATWNLSSSDTFTYVYDGNSYTVTYGSNDSGLSTEQVASTLNMRSQGPAQFSATLPDDEGRQSLVVSLGQDAPPNAILQIGTGSMNSQFGFTPGPHGQFEVYSGQSPYILSSATGASVASYLAIEVPEEGRIYTDQPDRIIGMFGENGQVLPLDDARANTHCPSSGPAAFDLGVAPGTRVFLKIASSSEPLWLMPSDPRSWMP